ncbi:MAG: hypothetical protein IJ617_07280 [Oscillospiraceae bacterium]|nr:hypothetical protein [Oscillospiraceae bacterium]
MDTGTQEAMLLRFFDGGEEGAPPDGGGEGCASEVGGTLDAAAVPDGSAEVPAELHPEYRSVLNAVARRYGIGEGDWKALEKALQDEAVQARSLARKRRGAEIAAARMLRSWAEEAEALRNKLPAFDLAAESRDGRFRAMLRSGVPLELAYRALHTEELLREGMYSAAAAAERRIVDNIRARGARPVEAGAAGQGGFTVREDVSRLSRQERAEIARRAAKGELISF